MRKRIQKIVLYSTIFTLTSATSFLFKLPLTDAQEDDQEAMEAVVFDPPSNVRLEPNNESKILCKVKSRKEIPILFDKNHPDWYVTYACGAEKGYIHKSQIHETGHEWLNNPNH